MHQASKFVYGELTFGFRQGTLLLTVTQKANRSAAPAKNEQSEYATFETALRKVLSVPHSKIKSKLASEKQKRASARASTGKD
jgi:hypothetical protein